jgi:uncharacterized protein YqcC (DUF446 family)
MSPNALKTLDEIEAEMRRIGYWSDSPELRPGACEGRFRSYLDAPTFRVWLQTLFLPNARAAALEGRLPARSQAGEIVRRQYALDAAAPEAQRLLALIGEFESLCLKAPRNPTA